MAEAIYTPAAAYEVFETSQQPAVRIVASLLAAGYGVYGRGEPEIAAAGVEGWFFASPLWWDYNGVWMVLGDFEGRVVGESFG